MNYDGFDDDLSDDRYDPLPEDLVNDDADDVFPCPSCGREIHEETEQCPYCGDWVMPLAAAAGRRSLVWVVAALLVIAGLLIVTLV